MLTISNVSFSYSGTVVLHHIDLMVKRGEMVALLGPNGSGKTTLIKLASGLLRSNQGQVCLSGSPLNRLKRRDVARQVAVVPQQFFTPFALTVREVVLLGRTPFLRAFSDEADGDRRTVERAMELVGISHLRNRFFNEISGGERQKTVLAMALAQEPGMLLLDEPTAHLDINHQVEILELVRSFNRERGLTIIGAMHDLNLAALYFNRLILLKQGQVFADGRPRDILTEATIKDVFSASVQVSLDPATGAPHIIVKPRSNRG